MKRISQLELTVLADIEPSLEDDYDALEYLFMQEFVPQAVKELHEDVAQTIARHRRVILGYKQELEEHTGRKWHIKLPRRIVKLPEAVYERFEPLMEIA